MEVHFFHIRGNMSFLDQYVACCCLTLGPTTVGQYLHLHTFLSEKPEIP